MQPGCTLPAEVAPHQAYSARPGPLGALDEFRDMVKAQGFGWALVRTVDDALGALADYGFTSRAQRPMRRAAP